MEMSQVYRCYVEKKPGFAVEAEHLFGELRHTPVSYTHLKRKGQRVASVDTT